MEKISFMRRLSSSLIDKVLILVLFIISALCISPYGMPGQRIFRVGKLSFKRIA